MRNIRFKAYIKNLKWMVPVESINFDCKTIEVDLSDGNGDLAEYNFDEVELMQYTGLKDKNDIDIYEGDIIEVMGKILTVSFGEQEYEDGENTIGYYGLNFFMYHHTFYGSSDGRGLEVIGNIYEDPELFEVEI